MRRLLFTAGVGFMGLLPCLDLRAEPGAQTTRATIVARTEPDLITVTYAVADLIVPIALNLDSPRMLEEIAAKKSPKDPGQDQPLGNVSEKQPVATQEEALIKLICSMVAPASWEKSGSWGKVQYFPLGMGLVIQQTKEAHEEIRALLAALRRLQEVEIAVDVRMIYLPEAAQDKILAAMDVAAKNKIAILDDAQQQSFLESIQADKRTEILHAPKITVFNGQRGTIQVTDNKFFLTGVQMSTANGQAFVMPRNEPMEFGFRSSVCPTVSAGRKLVFLDLQVKRTTLSDMVPLIPVQIPVPQMLEGPGKGSTTLGQPVVFQMFFQQPQFVTQIVDQKFSIPSGKTALIVAGKEQRENRNEFGAPVLSKIPYMSRLFKNVAYGRESCTTILLVTPRIIINNETSEVALPNDNPR